MSEQASEEEQKAIKTAKCIRAGVPVQTCDDDYIVLLNIIEKQQKEIEELKQNKKVLIKNYDKVLGTFISKETIRERIKHNEKQKNIVVSVAKFEINDDGITGEGIEDLNDLIVYKSYEAVINELNYLLEEN